MQVRLGRHRSPICILALPTMRPPDTKIKVGVLGATGLVGQLFVEYLLDHPWFEIGQLTGSDRTIGQRYGTAVDWLCESELPDRVADIVVEESRPREGVELVLSALHRDAALAIEPLYAASGIPVVSNASAFRMESGVPLIIPEVNGSHLQEVRQNTSGGFIVTSPNCSTIGLASALAPLERAFGIEHLHVTTMQALSGAGVPGVAAMHATANVIPYIGSEEDKLESEPQKILGLFTGDAEPADFAVSAQCNRVPVVDGHLCAVSVRLRSPVRVEDVRRIMSDFRGELDAEVLPTKPSQFLRLYDSEAEPQPRLHVNRDNGMSIGIGRIRACPINDIRFVCLVHNTKRGAAGNALLIAELAYARGMIGAHRSSVRLAEG